MMERNYFKKYYFSFLSLFLIAFPLAQQSSGTIDFIFSPAYDWDQTAVWLEDSKGNYIQTVFVTNFIGRNGGGNRDGKEDINSSSNRYSALPVWAHKRNVIDTTFGIENYYPPSQSHDSYPDDIDAVSGATPGDETITKSLQLNNLSYGKYICRIEVNQSFDRNDYHDYPSYRGQPSLVWSVEINVSDLADTRSIFNYEGYGSPDGSNGSISPPDSTITTAEDLLSDMGGFKFLINYNPGLVDVKQNKEQTKPAEFRLNQNYPNPFNPSTMINYQLPINSFVNLTVYNMLGQETATLVNKQQTAGNYEVKFDGSSLTSGVYLFKLTAGDFVSVKKLVLIK